MFRGVLPLRKSEFKAIFEQPSWHDSAALKNEFRFSAQKKCADFNHPRGSRETQSRAPGRAQITHELRVRQRIRRTNIDGTFKALASEQIINGAHKIIAVNPRNELRSAASRAAKTKTNKAQQRIEDAAAIRTHDHCRAQQDFPRVRRPGFVRRALPCRRHIDAEIPCVGRIGFVAADDSIRFVVWSVESMRIDRGGTHLQPTSRRFFCARNRLADYARGLHSRIKDGMAICRAIAAIHAATGEIDHRVRILQFRGPRTERMSVPCDDAP